VVPRYIIWNLLSYSGTLVDDTNDKVVVVIDDSEQQFKLDRSKAVEVEQSCLGTFQLFKFIV
jgi:hypothetical protein